MPSPNDLNLIDETLGEQPLQEGTPDGAMAAESMLQMLTAADKNQRMIAARYFCDHRMRAR